MGTVIVRMYKMKYILVLTIVFNIVKGENESFDDYPSHITKLMERVNELEMMLKKTKSIEDPTLEERLAAVEEKAELNSEDITDIRVINGRQDIMIEENQVTIMSNLGQIDTNMGNIGTNGEHIDTLNSQVNFIEETRPPVGAIVPWLGPSWMELPPGWQRCDGSEITVGPLSGRLTPDLNTAGRFLRGGGDEAIGNTEEATLQEHSHKDHGHTHVDHGHSHVDSGHSHRLDGGYGGSAGDGVYPAFIERKCEYTHSDKVLVDSDASHSYYCVDTVWDTLSTVAHIQAAAASIQAANSGLEGVEGASVGQETRPNNMRVSYIVRIY